MTADRPNDDVQPPPGLFQDFLRFLVHNPAWWLVPLILTLVLLVLVAVLIPAESLPFIYTL